MDIDIYNLDNFNKSPDVIKIIINYIHESITIYYNNIIDTTINMHRSEKYYMYGAFIICAVNNIHINELLSNKTFLIQNSNPYVFIDIMQLTLEDILYKPNVRIVNGENIHSQSDSTFLQIAFNYTNENQPKCQEDIMHIKIYNRLSSNRLQLLVRFECIYEEYHTKTSARTVDLFKSIKINLRHYNVFKCIFFSKIRMDDNKLYIANIINELTSKNYVEMMVMPSQNRVDVLAYFYKFKIKSFIILILKSFVTPTIYNFCNMQMSTSSTINKIYYDYTSPTAADFNKELSDSKFGCIKLPYFADYFYTYKCG